VKDKDKLINLAYDIKVSNNETASKLGKAFSEHIRGFLFSLGSKSDRDKLRSLVDREIKEYKDYFDSNSAIIEKYNEDQIVMLEKQKKEFDTFKLEVDAFEQQLEKF